MTYSCTGTDGEMDEDKDGGERRKWIEGPREEEDSSG